MSTISGVKPTGCWDTTVGYLKSGYETLKNLITRVCKAVRDTFVSAWNWVTNRSSAPEKKGPQVTATAAVTGKQSPPSLELEEKEDKGNKIDPQPLPSPEPGAATSTLPTTPGAPPRSPLAKLAVTAGALEAGGNRPPALAGPELSEPVGDGGVPVVGRTVSAPVGTAGGVDLASSAVLVDPAPAVAAASAPPAPAASTSWLSGRLNPFSK